MNRLAGAGGAYIGQGLRDALALVPELVAEPVDRAADAAALAGLGHWLVRLSPVVGVDGPDALIVDITGCAHLCGGEREMMDITLNRLKTAAAAPVFSAIAGTPLAAAACARYAPDTILPERGEREGLASLPIAALGVGIDTSTLLRRFGLSRIGQLYGVDRKALARRFKSKSAADDVTQRLDSGLGLRHAPFAPLKDLPDFTARLNCPDPIITREAVEIALEKLCQDLCTQLEAAGQGARAFNLTAFRADGGMSGSAIRTALPTRTYNHITRLFDNQLDNLDLGFGADCLILEARNLGALADHTPTMNPNFVQANEDVTAFARMADRIITRLGGNTVKVFTPTQRYLPEHAMLATGFDGHIPTLPNGQNTRPMRLLVRPESVRVLAEVPDGPPQRFIWRRVVHRIIRADGPERISPEWWYFLPRTQPSHATQDNPELEGELLPSPLPRARDYYRIENTDGQRFWVFRGGLYDDGRGSPPEWYVQGVFA